MKVYLMPRITCPLCHYEFNMVQNDPENTIVKLEHAPYFFNNEACPQVGHVGYIDVSQFAKDV